MNKAYFQHDMAYGDFKDLNRRTAADKLLRDKAFNIAKNPYYGCNVDLIQWFISFLIKKLQLKQLKKKFFVIKN